VNVNNPFSSIAGGINDTVNAYRNNPGPLNREIQQNSKKPILAQSLIKLMAAELINKEQAAKENDLRASMEVDSRTVADKTYDQLYAKKEQDIANRVAMVNRGRELQKRKAMNNLAKRQGIGALPTSLNQRPMGIPTNKMAGGGVVAFQPGGEVEVEPEPYTVGDAIVETGKEAVDYVVELAKEYPGVAIALGALPIIKRGKNLFGIATGLKDTIRKYAGPEGVARVYSGAKTITKPAAYGTAAVLAGSDILDIPIGEGEAAKEEKEKQKDDTPPPPLIGTGATASPRFNFDVDEQSKLYENKILGGLTGFASDQASAMSKIREMQDNEYYSPEAIQNRAKEREAKIEAGQKKVLDARDRGIAALKEGFATENTARENAIKTMQANVDKLAGRGEFEKAANIKDFIAALSTVGAGRNLGEGLGLGFRTLYNREDARARRAERGDKEIAALRLDNAKRINDQARDIFGIESDKAELIQEYLTAAQGREKDTQARMLAAQEIQNKLILAIEEIRGKVSAANLNAILNVANNRTELLKTAVSREGIATQDRAVMAKLFNGVASVISDLTAQIVMDPDSEGAKSIQASLENLRGLLDNLSSDLGISGP